MAELLDFVSRRWALLTLLLLFAITLLSLAPLPQLPSVPGTDKTHHLIAYAALMFPTALRKPGLWRWIGLFFILYSGVIELVQPFVNRYGEWLDLLANSGGVFCGWLLAEFANRCVKSKKPTWNSG